MQLIDGKILLNELGAEYFKAGSMFGALSEQGIRYLLTKGAVYELKKGDLLFQSGTRGDSFFIIIQGTVAFYSYHQNQYTFFHDFSFGEQVGFVSMIALQDRPGKAIAAKDSYVVEISSDLFYAFHCDNPQDFGLLMINLSRQMARVIVDTGKTLVEMSMKNPPMKAVDRNMEK